MKITRIVALAIVAASVSLVSGQSALQAQTLRSAGPPAEYPPASFKNKQYVDSRGCIYIRAGIDGNVNWVPRVTRSRKQICGYKPTTVAGSTARPVPTEAPEQITLPQSQSVAAVAPANGSARKPASASTAVPLSVPVPVVAAVSQPAPKPRKTAPVVVTTTKPQRSSQIATAQATPAPRRQVAVAAQHTSARPTAARPVAPVAAQSPATYGSGTYRSTGGAGLRSSQILAPNTRVLPAHVYEARRHSLGLTPPPGYRAAWEDDRLNLRRAERDLQPRVLTNGLEVPVGFVAVNRQDNRMNPMRGIRSEGGEAQMAAIWQEGIPRKLVHLPQNRRTVIVTGTGRDRFNGDAHSNTLLMRLSSRSEPGSALRDPKQAKAKPVSHRYVRAATFADAAQAQKAARALAAKGLPVHLGAVSRQGVPYKVVLAGPFADLSRAEAALQQVRAAGHKGARISK